MRRRRVSGLAALVVAGFTLSGCATVEGLVGDVSALFGQDEQSTTDAADSSQTDTDAADGTDVTEQEAAKTDSPTVVAAVPECPDMFSAEQRSAFESEGRQPEGDRSGEGYNYGTDQPGSHHRVGGGTGRPQRVLHLVPPARVWLHHHHLLSWQPSE
jgi:hypothetical protein